MNQQMKEQQSITEEITARSQANVDKVSRIVEEKEKQLSLLTSQCQEAQKRYEDVNVENRSLRQGTSNKVYTHAP